MSFDLTSSMDSNIMSNTGDDLYKYVHSSLTGTSYDIATVVHFLYKDVYKVARLKSKIWYCFDGLKWRPSELGPYYKLSTTVVNIYETQKKEELEKKKVYEEQLEEITNNINENSDREIKFFKNTLANTDKILARLDKIIEKLKNVNSKESICKECLYLFYDPDFLFNLDINPNLICFTNGILDMQENTLRPGEPEDNISLSIKRDFVVPKTKTEQIEMGKIIEEFRKFSAKITSKRQNRLVFIV